MKNTLLYNQQMQQKMALTPQMRQNLRLLNMPAKDLVEYINSAVAANPFLQKTTEVSTKNSGPDSTSYDSAQHIQQDDNPRLNLVSQLRMSGLKDTTLEIAEYLIYEMDENGYIMSNIQEVANELSANVEEVQKALWAIQAMDPPGIGACSVQECLQLQLRRAGKERSVEYAIVSDYLNELARNDIQKISAGLNVSVEKTQQAVTNIKKLNPRPASSMLSKGAERVLPDLIAMVKGKKVRLEISRAGVPQLTLYNPYENRLEIIKDAEAKKFLKENMNAAKNLIDGLRRREETMCRVADYILNFQKEALSKDRRDIKTLTIKEVAQALKMNPSTISRAIFHKYVQVQDEVMPLNAFLSKGVEKEDGTSVSKSAVKKKIALLIKNENENQPLTDRAIQERLKQEDIRVQRRTIAKYRNALRLLPAYLRKKSHI